VTRALIALAGGVTVAQGWAGPCSRIWAVSIGAVPHVDVAAVEDVVLAWARSPPLTPEIAELDCNPVIARPAGTLVVDARVRIAPPPPRRPYEALDR
jgi:hypothetical protein